MKQRCSWCGDHGLYQAYHDEEWGVPARDDHRLFEMLILEGAQAGLNWLTILKKREAYRRAFAAFDPIQVAGFSEASVEALMRNEGIVRNRLKIHSAIRNARVFCELQSRHGSFASWLWAFVDGEPIRNYFGSMAEVPASTPLSEQISRELKRAGMNFVGPTILYAYMQSVGLVNDHVTSCFRHAELAGE